MTTTTSHNPSYTFLKQGIYYFSKRIPIDLQHQYRQPRVVQSLKTRSVKEAAKTARHLSQRLETYWQELRLQQQDAVPFEYLLKNRRQQLTLSDAFQLYLEIKGQGRSQLFFISAQRHVDYLVQTSSNKALKHYTSIDATHYRQWLQDKGLANASVHKAFACIKAIFTLAIKEQGLTMQNPFSNIYLPSEKDDAKKRLPITIADIRLIQRHCKAVDDDMRWLVALISDTGMRLPEAAGLMLNDLCLDEDIPHVVIQPHKHRPLKTRSSERIVPLVGASLWAAQRIAHNAQVSDYCFPRYCNAKGCSSNSASAALNKWLKVVTGNKDYVLHGLRHSFRDRLRAVDAPIEMIDRLGGWSLKSVGQGYGDGYRLGQIHLTMKMLGAE